MKLRGAKNEFLSLWVRFGVQRRSLGEQAISIGRYSRINNNNKLLFMTRRSSIDEGHQTIHVSQGPVDSRLKPTKSGQRRLLWIMTSKLDAG